MPRKAKLPPELTVEKENKVARFDSFESCANHYRQIAKKVLEDTDFFELRCNHSWWIENNVLKPMEYFLDNKGHKIAYSPEDLKKALDLLVELTTLYNAKTRYQPTVITFCRFIGISTNTFNNWSCENNERGETIRLIQDYFKSILTQGMVTGELNPVAGAFIGKSTLGMKENDGNTTNINIIGGDVLGVEEIMNEYAKNRK